MVNGSVLRVVGWSVCLEFRVAGCDVARVLRWVGQVCSLVGHKGHVTSLAFSSDGTRMVTGSEDMLVKIWDTKTWAEVHCFMGVR